MKVQVINIILSVIALYVMTCFFYGVITEAGGRRWITRRKPRLKKKEEGRRFLVSLKNKDVMIAYFDGNTQKFNMPDVVAWRKLPKGMKRTNEIYFFWRKKNEKN